MNTLINFFKKLFGSLFGKAKKVVKLPAQGEEYDGWLGV